MFTPLDPPARLTTLRDRLARLEAIGLVDYVIVQRFNRAFAALSPQAFIEKMLCQQLHTRYLLIGDDFRFERNVKATLAYSRHNLLLKQKPCQPWH